MDQVKLGIVGVGNMGSSHCRSILNGDIPELKLTAAADIRETRRDWARENLPSDVAVFESMEAMLQSGLVEAVLIAVPHYAHPELAISAMKRGVHVLCEKPAGVYTRQVREMNEVAEKSSVVFALMYNQRTNPIYIKLHELVQSGEYGRMKRMNWMVTDWYRTQAYYDSGDWRATWDGEGGGVLLNQCPHQLDLLQWICGMPEKVRGFCHEGKWHRIEVEDDVTAYLEFPGGATGVFVTSTGDYPGTNRLEIDLERGKLVSEDGKLMLYALEESERDFCFTAREGFGRIPGTWQDITPGGDNPQHAGVMRQFAGAILRGEPLVANGTEGIRGLTISNAIHLSSWLGETVTIPFDEELFLKELNLRRARSKRKENVAETTFDTEGTY